MNDHIELTKFNVYYLGELKQIVRIKPSLIVDYYSKNDYDVSYTVLEYVDCFCKKRKVQIEEHTEIIDQILEDFSNGIRQKPLQTMEGLE